MFKQTNRTAIGTPHAVVHANSCAGRAERTEIIKKYKENLPFLGRFTDDMMGIWRFDNDCNEFQDCFTRMNQTTSSQWTLEGPTKSINFMDLNITIDDNRNLTFKTHQKPASLHQCIPSNSAHPPGTLKSMTRRRTRKHWVNNSKEADFPHFMNSLTTGLIKQGHTKPSIKEHTAKALVKCKSIFLDTDKSLQTEKTFFTN